MRPGLIQPAFQLDMAERRVLLEEVLAVHLDQFPGHQAPFQHIQYTCRYETSYPGQLSLAIPPWVGAMSSRWKG